MGLVSPSQRSRLHWGLAGLSLAVALLVTVFVPAVPQWQDYHDFADRRAWLGIPNFLDVASNLFFCLVGLMGLRRLSRERGRFFLDPREAVPWSVFFLGLVFLGPASAWYHLAPNDAGLMWDRLAMSVVFMAWLAIHLGERLGPRLGLAALPWLLALGIGSVLYWYDSELAGRGDLRAWGYVQFWPVLLILLMIWLTPARYDRTGDVLGVFAFYAAALLAEWLDRPILDATGVFSGHTLKHALAALGAYWAYRWLRRRQALVRG
jgi:hypothetical protein